MLKRAVGFLTVFYPGRCLASGHDSTLSPHISILTGRTVPASSTPSSKFLCLIWYLAGNGTEIAPYCRVSGNVDTPARKV
jgi:hypothetical protein